MILGFEILSSARPRRPAKAGLCRSGHNRSSTDERRARHYRGILAEWLAAAMLWLKGYRILARRYRVRSGEIDIVAVRGRMLTFVEVKMRQTEQLGCDALTPRGSRRSRAAALSWTASRPRYHEFGRRFDAVLVMPWRLPRHLPGIA